MNREKLFEPIQIGSMTVKNRIVMAPMGNNYGAGEGFVSDLTIDHYVQRAKNEVGLLITEAMYVHPSGAHREKAMGLTREAFVPGLKKLTGAVHAAGAAIASQLSHAGRVVAHAHRPGGFGPWGPSSVPHRGTGELAKAMTVEEIEGMIESFGAAAVRARRSGFDAVELHGTHGYLLMAFVSALFNKRTDQYGGSLDNRIRFALEVVASVKRHAGSDFPVIYRMAGEELLPGGQTLEEGKYLAKKLAEAGVDALHVSGGNNETPDDMRKSIATMYTEPGYFVDYAAGIKAEVGIPVIAVGRLGDPERAEQVLASRKADLICLGRALFADPAWAKKIKEGREDEIVPCIACNMGCIERLGKQQAVCCVQNPLMGRDPSCMSPTGKPKRIAVIGAGLAGLEFALRATLRGHCVEVFEKGDAPGGQVILAARSPHKNIFLELVGARIKRVNELGIPIHYHTPVDAGQDWTGWDHIVVATGGTPILPDLPWVVAPIVRDAFAVLKERTMPSRPGGAAVVMGGGSIGLETAHMLEDNGFSVEVVELGGAPGMNLAPTIRAALMEQLEASGVRVNLNSTVTGIEENRVIITTGGKDRAVEDVELMVVAIGTCPEEALIKQLKDRGLTASAIGNSAGAANALDTAMQACELALFV